MTLTDDLKNKRLQCILDLGIVCVRNNVDVKIPCRTTCSQSSNTLKLKAYRLLHVRSPLRGTPGSRVHTGTILFPVTGPSRDL
jgi:hypothetical protein